MGLKLRQVERALNRMDYIDRKVKEIRQVQLSGLYSKLEKEQWAKMLPFYEQRYKMEEKRLFP